MDYRRKANDSDSSSDNGDGLSLDTDESSVGEEEDNGPIAKRAARLWGDALMEQNLLQRSSGITLEKVDDNRVNRGVESYQVPKNFKKKNEFDSSTESLHCDEAFASTDDPFGDSAIDLSAETAVCEEKSCCSSSKTIANKAFKKESSHVPSGRGRGPRGRRCNVNVYRGKQGTGGCKRSWQGKIKNRDVLLSPSYSLETLMAVEFSSDLSIEELGYQIAKAMGERDPEMIQSIVRVCGIDKAISLFEKTRNVESTGGMMVESGQRRRTPGGVFISLFRLDSDIPEDDKKRLFSEKKQNLRKLVRARRKGRFNFPEKVAKLAELMKKEKEKDSETNSLRPLPQAEILLQKDAMLHEAKHVFDNDKSENSEMML